jgi:soluble lytic murein transglycosylase
LPGVQRAYELRALNRNLDARREWNALIEHQPPNDQRALAVIASEWGWHDQAIYTLGILGEYDAIAQRFPTAYMEEHQEFASAVNIDVNWALAVSRRESAFRDDARSHAGAYGLMQLLPSTANLVERRDVSVHELFNPSYNIRLGTRYLADLQRRLGNNWILATAAYNAGIYRVYDWLPAQPMEVDRWIELIPYVETRNYVKNVLAYQQIYRTLRENELQPELFGELVPMQISGAQLKR